MSCGYAILFAVTMHELVVSADSAAAVAYYSSNASDFDARLGSADNYTSIINLNNSSSIMCDKVGHSVDEFPPDFFTEEQRRNGAIFIHLLVAFYGFIFITFICHDYFLPSVFCICLDLGISPDVAGATFMATATSTSELFVSIIGTFLTESDLGVGTVVGSGVYNTLGVSACAGLAARRAVVVHKWPLLRDSAVYVGSIAVLAAIAVDNMVVWYEALTMMLMYLGYFLFLFTQDRLVTVIEQLKDNNYSYRSWTVFFLYAKQLILSALFCRKFDSNEFQNITLNKNNMQPHHYGTVKHHQTLESSTITIMTTSNDGEPSEVNIENQEVSSRTKSFGYNLLMSIWWTFCLPVTLTLSSTIPDCRTRRKLYPLTFIMSITWISVVTYVLSWMLTICGDTFQISDIVMGMGILAVGSSIPELISGIINARNDEGSMIISSALGSNTMDILLCLGLPWFIKCLLPVSMNGGPVMMETNSLFFNCMCMIASVVVLDLATVVSGFKMYKPFGFMCLAGQIVVITVLIINSLNVTKNAEIIGRC